MADNKLISKIKIDGVLYEIKDAFARNFIKGGVSFLGICSENLSDGATVSTVTIGGNTVTPTEAGSMVCDAQGREYIAANVGGTLKWQELGRGDEFGAMAFADTGTVTVAAHTHTLNKSDKTLKHTVTSNGTASVSGKFTPEGSVADISYTPAGANQASSVSFAQHTTDKALGEATTFTNASSAVTFTSHTKKSVLPSTTTGTVPAYDLGEATKTIIKATVKGGNAAVGETAAAITELNTGTVGLTTSKLDKTSVGSASNWSAGTMFAASYEGESTETLDLTSGRVPSLTVTDTAVGAGTVSANGTGSPVGTALSGTKTFATGTPKTTADVAKTVTFTAPTVELGASANANAATGEVAVVTAQGTLSQKGTDAVTFANNTAIEAITALGTGTAAAQTITVGTNDKVTAITALGAATAAAQTFKGTAATLSTTFTGTEGDIAASGNVSNIAIADHTVSTANSIADAAKQTLTVSPVAKV